MWFGVGRYVLLCGCVWGSQGLVSMFLEVIVLDFFTSTSLSVLLYKVLAKILNVPQISFAVVINGNFASFLKE